MRPVLEVLADGKVRPIKELRNEIANRVGITAEERDELYGGGGRRFDGRANWAVTYLAGAAAVSRPGRGQVQITDRGRQLLAELPGRIVVRDLRRFPEFAEFYERATASQRRTAPDPGPIDDPVEHREPVEQIRLAVDEINSTVAAELVERIKAQPPEFLERMILALMTAMGYGATLGRVEHLGGPGDEGFDGVIHQDALGLERVYLQAKRYSENTVGRPAVQAFAGALQGVGANRGVFITTSRFTGDAIDFAARLPARVVLIDGPELGRLLVKHKVGVQVKQRFEIVEVDEDVFDL